MRCACVVVVTAAAATCLVCFVVFVLVNVAKGKRLKISSIVEADGAARHACGWEAERGWQK